VVLGARPIGSRTVGDGTGDSGVTLTPAAPPEELAFTFTGTGDLALTHTEFLALAFTGTGDLVVAGAESYGLAFALEGSGTLGVAWPPTGRRRRVVPTQLDGTPYVGELADATYDTVSWTLNEPDSYGITMPSASPLAVEVHAERLREAQLWLGDSIMTWGPMVTPGQESGGALSVAGRGADWHFMRRHVGKADRRNYLQNPSFEDGLAHWSPGFFSPAEPEVGRPPGYVLGSVSSERSVRGRYSARIETPSDTFPYYGSRLLQSIVFEVDGAAQDGDVWTASIQIYIPSATLRSTAGDPPVGLYVGRFSTTEFVPVYSIPDGIYRGDYPVGIEGARAPITPDTPLDRWHRLSVDLVQPVTGEPEFIAFYLMVPKGVTFADDAMLARNERIEGFALEQTNYIDELVTHLQDSAYDKTDVNITADTPATGILRDRTYLHSEHVNGWTSIHDFTTVRDGVDLSMLYTPTERVLRTHFPARGRYRPRHRLSYGLNFGAYRWTFDGDSANTSVVTLGEGADSTREEGFATDTSGFAEGVTLEEVFAPGPDTPLDALDAQADEWLDVTRTPEVLEVTTYPDTPLLGRLSLGDWVPVDLHDGALHIPPVGATEEVTYRVVRMDLNPDNSLTMALNRRPVMT
jgi:hypothetical protein